MIKQTKGAKRIAELDGLRASAILLVLGCHIQIFLSILPKNNLVAWFFAQTAWNGIYLFFVLSGFLIGGLCFNELQASSSIHLPPFWARRIMRTWPLYFFALGMNYFFLKHQELTPSLIHYLTFTQVFFKMNLFIESWTLCVEEHFYLLLPVILILAYRKDNPARIFWVLTVLMLSAYVYRYKYGYSLNTFGVIDSLVIGVMVAYWKKFNPSAIERLCRFPNLLLLVGLIFVYVPFLFSCLRKGIFFQRFFQGSQGIGFGLVLLSSMNPKVMIGPYLRSRFCRFIAEISYSLYLCHMFVIFVAQKWIESFRHSWIQVFIFALATFLACCAIAYCLYLLIESPWLSLRERLVPRSSKKALFPSSQVDEQVLKMDT